MKCNELAHERSELYILLKDPKDTVDLYSTLGAFRKLLDGLQGMVSFLIQRLFLPQFLP